jgi:hypothetical protein
MKGSNLMTEEEKAGGKNSLLNKRNSMKEIIYFEEELKFLEEWLAKTKVDEECTKVIYIAKETSNNCQQQWYI